jgi:hypothetical protein
MHLRRHCLLHGYRVPSNPSAGMAPAAGTGARAVTGRPRAHLDNGEPARRPEVAVP